MSTNPVLPRELDPKVETLEGPDEDSKKSPQAWLRKTV